ncbi:MAG TPA: hypothetical protein VJV78_13550 [Polyangiales bacterium]|nr:hypothetical protein [Polyangiales bacterium]
MSCRGLLAIVLLTLAAAGSRAAAQSEADAIGFGGDEPASGENVPPPAASGSAADGGEAVQAEMAAAPADESSPWTFRTGLTLFGAIRLERDGPYRIGSAGQALDLALEYRQRLGEMVLRAQLAGHLESDFAYLINRANYDAPTLELYGWQLWVGESYLALQWPVFELSVGTQIVNFGPGEMLGVLDVVNPRDVRNLFVADPGDMRLPVLMTRAKLNLDRFRFELVVVHEPYFGLSAPPLGEFSPFRRLLLDDAALGPALAGHEMRLMHLPPRDLRELEATQVHAFLSWSLPNVDLSLLASSFLDPLGVPGFPEPSAWDNTSLEFPVLHPRFTLLGTAGAWTVGAFVLRWEAAFAIERPLATRAPDTTLLMIREARSHVATGLLGITWQPSFTTSAALEVSQSYVFQDLSLLFPIEATQIAVRFSQQFFSERLTFSLLSLLIGVTTFNAWVGRAELSYALSDGLSVAIGYVTYQPSDRFGLFYGFDRNDRLFATLRTNAVH